MRRKTRSPLLVSIAYEGHRSILYFDGHRPLN